jgi:hypothetical protein
MGGALSLEEISMALEALWAITFGTTQDSGSGVVVFETGRVFGGDTAFYYVGHYTYTPHNQIVSGEVEVTRHAPGLPFIIPGHEGGHYQFTGRVVQPTMTLTGHLVEDPQQRIVVHCRHLHDLP